jgi:hypothetical protein
LKFKLKLGVKKRFKSSFKPRTFTSYGANTNTATENAGGAKLYTNLKDIFSSTIYFYSLTFFLKKISPFNFKTAKTIGSTWFVLKKSN